MENMSRAEFRRWLKTLEKSDALGWQETNEKTTWLCDNSGISVNDIRFEQFQDIAEAYLEKMLPEDKPMKVNINSEKITKTLEKAQEKYRVNCLDQTNLRFITGEAENRLSELCIPKAYRKGAKITYRPGGPSRAYKYKQGATKVTLERGEKDWFLTAIDREDIYPMQSPIKNLELTEKQKDFAEICFSMKTRQF